MKKMKGNEIIRTYIEEPLMETVKLFPDCISIIPPRLMSVSSDILTMHPFRI